MTPGLAYELMKVLVDSECFKLLTPYKNECKVSKHEIEDILNQWMHEILYHLPAVNLQVADTEMVQSGANANLQLSSDRSDDARSSRRSLWSVREDTQLLDGIVEFADRKKCGFEDEMERILENLQIGKIDLGLVSCIRKDVKRTRSAVHNRIKFILRKDFNNFKLKLLNRVDAYRNRSSYC